MNCEFDNNTPIYLQLAQQIETDIISGKIESGARLPSVRELAIIFKVNPNTVQKALSELENTKLIFTERTNGKFVTTEKELIENKRSEYAERLNKKFIDDMKSIGINTADAISILKEWSDRNE